MTLATIPLGQFVGGLLWIASLAFYGAYLLWIRPAELRRKVQTGKLTEVEACQKLQKPNPKIGYLIFLCAAGQLAIVLMQWFSTT